MKGDNNINFDAKINSNKEIGNKISENLKEYYKRNQSHRKGKTNVEIFGKENAIIASKKLSKIASERTGSKILFIVNTILLKQKIFYLKKEWVNILEVRI